MIYQKDNYINKYSDGFLNIYEGCSYKEDITEIIAVVEKTLSKIAYGANTQWTEYDSVTDLKRDINNKLYELRKGDLQQLQLLKTDFLPTSTFQEIALDNGWEAFYMEQAQKFDILYKKITNNVEYVVLHQSEGEKNAYFKKISKLWKMLLNLFKNLSSS